MQVANLLGVFESGKLQLASLLGVLREWGMQIRRSWGCLISWNCVRCRYNVLGDVCSFIRREVRFPGLSGISGIRGGASHCVGGGIICSIPSVFLF
jgi:hypothetical protein